MAYKSGSDVSSTRPYFIHAFTAQDAIDKIAATDSPDDRLVIPVSQTEGATTLSIHVPAYGSCELYYQLCPTKQSASVSEILALPKIVASDYQSSDSAVINGGATGFSGMQLIPGPISALVLKNVTGEGEFVVEILLQK